MFRGCITALVTPFARGRLDTAGLKKNVRFQLGNQADGLLVGGSTGEAAALSPQEWEQAVRTVAAEVRGRIPIIVGAGTNSTHKSIVQVRRAKSLGASGLLVVAPYYVKPTQEGLYCHFRALAEATDLPTIIYNIPGRTAVNVLPETIERLAKDCPSVVAVKEASGLPDQSSEILIRCGERITVLSGDDTLTLSILSVGGAGVISVVSNIAPADVAAMVTSFRNGDARAAQRVHLRLFPLTRAIFCETNPIPIKAAMEMLGHAAGEPRLPLTPLSEAGRKTVRLALERYGLLGPAAAKKRRAKR